MAPSNAEFRPSAKACPPRAGPAAARSRARGSRQWWFALCVAAAEFQLPAVTCMRIRAATGFVERVARESEESPIQDAAHVAQAATSKAASHATANLSHQQHAQALNVSGQQAVLTAGATLKHSAAEAGTYRKLATPSCQVDKTKGRRMCTSECRCPWYQSCFQTDASVPSFCSLSVSWNIVLSIIVLVLPLYLMLNVRHYLMDLSDEAELARVLKVVQEEDAARGRGQVKKLEEPTPR